MRSEILAAGALIAIAVVAVDRLDDRRPINQPVEYTHTEDEAALLGAARASGGEPPAAASWGREVRIPAGPNHQFFVTASVNDRAASFLVDTGASYVALRDVDARAAGVYTQWTDYTHRVRTANGETKAALVKLGVIEINGLRIENVEAFVLPDDQLGMNLLGMSFLARLESVEARRGELVLRG